MSRTFVRALIAIALIVAVPGIACICYYASTGIAPRRAGWELPVRLAYPVALVALAAVVVCALQAPRRRIGLRIATACFVASTLLLAVARGHLFGF